MPVSPITLTDWSKIVHYVPSDFKHPEKLDFGVVQGLDRLASRLGLKALILSDYRPFSKVSASQHSEGRAIDFAYPSLNPMTVLDAIRDIKVFSGFGMYVNRLKAFSFHVDTRTDRNPDTPATWGASKDRGTGQTEWAYVALRSIIDKYIPAAIPAFVWMVVMGVGIYWLAKRT